MHPLNSKYFGSGNGKIQISFHNGSSVVTGYVVRQVGTSRFVVTVDGVTTYTVLLAQTTSLASSLTAGYATILVNPTGGGSAEHAMKITSTKVTTTEGNSYNWAAATPTASLDVIDMVPAAFSFTDVTDATTSATVSSNKVTISGIDAPAAISVAGGQYQIYQSDGTTVVKPWGTTASTISSGQQVQLRVTASGTAATAVNVVLTVGGVSDTWTVTTAA